MNQQRTSKWRYPFKKFGDKRKEGQGRSLTDGRIKTFLFLKGKEVLNKIAGLEEEICRDDARWKEKMALE